MPSNNILSDLAACAVNGSVFREPGLKSEGNFLSGSRSSTTVPHKTAVSAEHRTSRVTGAWTLTWRCIVGVIAVPVPEIVTKAFHSSMQVFSISNKSKETKFHKE
ncbi:hypothetical protein PoB_007370000 [Plakobranchus ocellatus]|uniref:Uncharacterized protein n=1 Tax=Plakobranchus ocellatus TaxID=259542 RepID=A0AAV4DT82_9GAST|nr:hypothetical protein PoB_007370000 [Plakobranchus ocellatus]